MSFISHQSDVAKFENIPVMLLPSPSCLVYQLLDSSIKGKEMTSGNAKHKSFRDDGTSEGCSVLQNSTLELER